MPPEALPSAVALNGISYNIARSFGPAVGGVIVASLGAVAAFACNAILYLPLLVVLLLWRRKTEPSRLPREKLNRAMVSGFRYITNSPPIKIVLLRTLVMGLIGGAIMALMPLIARDLLHGGAQTYGIMLGAFGMGAVVGALNIHELRKRMSGEAAIRACTISMAFAMAALAVSTEPVLTAAALVLAGAVWMAAVALFNIGVQLSAPRWVAGRSLAAFQASISGGIAIGAWGWGHLTDYAGVEVALLTAAGLMLISPVLGIWLAMPRVGARNEDADVLADPEVKLSLTGAQRAAGGRDRISRRPGERARLPQCDAGRAALPAAQRRLWLVDRARHRRSRIVDRALPLSDLARLSCASATARHSPNARCISRRSISTSAPIRCGSAACWSVRSARCAGRRRRRIVPAPRCCRWSRARREAARRFSQNVARMERSAIRDDLTARADAGFRSSGYDGTSYCP